MLGGRGVCPAAAHFSFFAKESKQKKKATRLSESLQLRFRQPGGQSGGPRKLACQTGARP
jgi:hypothetical protein